MNNASAQDLHKCQYGEVKDGARDVQGMPRRSRRWRWRVVPLTGRRRRRRSTRSDTRTVLKSQRPGPLESVGDAFSRLDVVYSMLSRIPYVLTLFVTSDMNVREMNPEA